MYGSSCIGLVLLVWWLLTVGEGDSRLVDAYTLPSPGDTFASFPDLWRRGLSLSVVISLGRVLGGSIGVGDALRELRLQPVVRLGVTYSF